MKAFHLLAAFVLVITLTACSQSASASDYTAVEISVRITDSQQDLSQLETLAMGDEGFSEFLFNYYGIEEALLEDGVFCYTDSGANAREVTVLRFKEGADMGEAEELLRQYVKSRIITYQGYMPDQVFLLEQAQVVVIGQFAALVVCDEPYDAVEVFADCFDPKSSSISGYKRHESL